MDGNGQLSGSVKTANGSLSDCQPIYSGGDVVWYTTHSSTPVFYAIDGSTGNFQSSGSLSQGSGQSGIQTPSEADNQAQNQPNVQGQTGFSDVPANAFYANAVEWAVNNGITAGTSATTFSPNAACTRAQMVTFLWRAAGEPKVGGRNPFTDVPSDAFYYDAVLWAVGKGITSGTSATTFSPNATVTRGQTVTFLHRFSGSLAVSGSSPFTDVDTGAYYSAAVQWAVHKGITAGTSATTFSPNADCTRGQIVTFLYRDLAE